MSGVDTFDGATARRAHARMQASLCRLSAGRGATASPDPYEGQGGWRAAARSVDHGVYCRRVGCLATRHPSEALAMESPSECAAGLPPLPRVCKGVACFYPLRGSFEPLEGGGIAVDDEPMLDDACVWVAESLVAGVSVTSRGRPPSPLHLSTPRPSLLPRPSPIPFWQFRLRDELKPWR